MSRIAVVSFRLGVTDGVSIEAAKWSWALGELGHEVFSVAGSGVADRLLEGLAISAATPPSVAELTDALSDADLVIVENLASLPLNEGAREVLYQVLEGRAALFHHHDLPWQREHLAHLAGPRDAPSWRHVTINDISRRQLAQRGIVATTVHNSFDCSPAPGRREETRRALDLDARTLIGLPTRAIPRKNVAGALSLSRDLGAVLWIMGPPEDGYDEEFEELLATSKVPVRRLLPNAVTMSDAYAACDLVVMPSSWEGFGTPVLESVTHRRPLALNPYPVAREIAAFGFAFFDLHDVGGLGRFLDDPDPRMFEANLEIARRHFNVADLPRRLRALIAGLLADDDD